MLVATDVTRYLDFKLVEGCVPRQSIDRSVWRCNAHAAHLLLPPRRCYVYKRGSGLHKVPATLEEATSTSLLSLLQKNWLRSLLQAIDAYDPAVPSTWKGGMDWSKSTSADLFKCVCPRAPGCHG